MAYIINKSNGSKLVTIEDGSINVTACDLSLVGKNYAGYGESIATNFVKLLENFSGAKQPGKPLLGQLWYDSSNRKLKFFNGSDFKSLASLQAGKDYPSDQLKGDLHYNETEDKLYYFDGQKYILIGPQTSGKAAINTVTPVLLEGTDGLFRYVLKHQIQNYYNETQTVAVAITSDDEFTPLSADYSVSFPKIKRGITLRATDSSSGVSSTSAATGYMLWGTSSDSLRLNNKLAAEYVTYAEPNFSSQVRVLTSDGINIASNGLRMFTNVNGAQLNTDLTRISLNATSGGELFNIINIDASDNLALLPSRTLGTLVNIGSASNPFNNVYANVYNTTGADLAENYLADAEYEPGTVLRLGGAAEVTICASYEHEGIAGIVSTQPGHLLNQGLANGTAIALKGRVPCKVKGPVKKGDVLVSSSTPGHAEVRRYGHRTNPLAVLGKALQDFDGEAGVIEVMVY
jgi:hypothetical protein